MTTEHAGFVIVEDAVGARLALDDSAHEWLRARGHVHGDDQPYTSLSTADELRELLATKPGHECHLCHATPTTHRVNLREDFDLTVGPLAGPRSPSVPLLVCGACAGMIERGDKAELVEHLVHAIGQYIKSTGALDEREIASGVRVSPDYVLHTEMNKRLRADIKPLIDRLFAVRRGRPEPCR